MKTTIKKPIIPGTKEKMSYPPYNSAEYLNLSFNSPIRSIESTYGFNISPSYINDCFGMTGILFETGYSDDNKYNSSFFLNPQDAIKLGNSIIESANKCIEYNEVVRNRDKMINILRNNIMRGYVDTLVVKFHKKITMETNNPYAHIYNIYPIYKEGIKNNHFNFNIPLCITNFRSIDGTDMKEDEIKECLVSCIKSMFIYNGYFYLNEDLNSKIKEYTNFKVKLVNTRKIIEEDYKLSCNENKIIRNNYKNNQQQLLENAQYAAERNSRMRELLKEVPKKENGVIDFKEALKTLNINL